MTTESAELEARVGRIETVLTAPAPDDEVDLGLLIRLMWRGKWVISGLAVLGAVVSVILALLIPNEYRATTVLAPASASGASSLSRLAGQFSGLASLANIDVGSDAAIDKTVVAIELMKSWGFLDEFIRSNELAVPLLAAKGWNRSTDTLVIDPEIYDPARKGWTGKGIDEQVDGEGPGSWSLYKEMVERISVNQDKKTNLVSVSVEYYSPRLAKEWAEKLVQAVNQTIQEQDREEASRSIQYLQDQMSGTNLVGMQQVFSRLIEEQTKNLMLANISDDYVLRPISPIKVPEKKSRPSRSVICVLGTLLGGGLGAMVWLLVVAVRRSRGEA